MPQLVGRDEELAAVLRVLDAPELLPGVAVLSGEAGIGKTALWLAGIDAAAAAGYRVMSARPSEAETTFSFAGLTDLLGNTAADVLPELPPIQRRALEAALLLGESEIQANERAVAAAFLGALRLLACDSPLCVAVDDIQWLDAASLSALGHALARLDREPVAALLAVRGCVPSWLRRAVPEDRLRTIGVDGLSVGATHELLHARLDATFSRPTLIRLWETAGGNPFFVLELATALQQRGGTLAPGEELPIPADLDQLLRARIDGLRPAALEVARAVAALGDPTVALVEAAVGARFDHGLAGALDAGILERDGPRLRFTHPLLATAVAGHETPARRRLLNARLAEIVPSPEERARHLALATAAPDDVVAAVIEEAARTALLRGAPAAAAELAEQALRLTPTASRDDARRRLFVAADMLRSAGDTDRAAALLEPARAAARPGNERASVVAQLADVQTSPRDAVALYREALLDADGDDALQATIHLRLASLMRFSDGVQRGIEHAEFGRRRRVAHRRHRAPLPRARGVRTPPLRRRARHPRQGDARGALARALIARLASRRRPDRRLRSSALVVGGCGRRTRALRGSPGRCADTERLGGRVGSALVPGFPRVACRELGGRGPLRGRLGRPPGAARSGVARWRVARGCDRSPPGSDRRGTRRGHRARSPGPRPRGSASRSRATVGCSASSSSRSETPQRLCRTSDARTSFATTSCSSRECGSSWAICSRR